MRCGMKIVGLILLSLNVLAQTGPGGVGNSSNNILWLKADAITGISNGNPITTWNDQSGNGNNFTQSNASSRPIWTEVNANFNNRPTVTFDGSDDFFAFHSATLNSVASNYTLFFVYRTASTSSQFLFDTKTGRLKIPHEGAGDKAYHDGGGRGVEIIGTATKLVAWELKDQNGSGIYEDGVKTQSGLAYTKRAMNERTSIGADEKGGGKRFNGNIAEAIFFLNNTNNAQRIIIENYLAAKYGLTIENDLYAYETVHGNDVVGIGRLDVSNQHTVATSVNLITISEPSSLGNNEFLLMGHDAAGITSWTTTETPNSSMYRVAREWRLNETGSVGTVTFSLDTTILPAKPVGFSKYYLLMDTDGDFTSGSRIVPLQFDGGNYVANDVSFNDGDYLTIAVGMPIIEFSALTANGLESGTNVNIGVKVNFISASDVTLDFVVKGGTATITDDFTPASGTVTIPAGVSTGSFSITIVDDTEIEPDETIIIALRNSPSGTAIGEDSVFTYTINDNDNSRKIQFAAASASGLENVSPVNFTIELIEINLSDTTMVDYVVTGGTASGNGVDYTLNNGRAKIPPGSMSVNIPITVTDDALDEDDETIIITLFNPSNNVNINSQSVFTYTILDNDASPVLSFDVTEMINMEAYSSPGITVSLSAVSGKSISVDYKVTGGTATGGGVDFSLPDGTITISAGETSGDIPLVIVDDVEIELNETVRITLSNPVNVTVGADSVFLYTIVDDDNLSDHGPGGVGDGDPNILWLRADRITGVGDGAGMSTWLDQSGNEYDAVQATASRQPKFTASNADFNGMPTVLFDGSDDFFDLAALEHTASNYSVFIVYKSTSTTRQSLFDSKVGRLKLAHEGDTGDRAYNDGTSRGVEITGTNAQIVMWELNSAGSNIYINGNLSQSGLTYVQRAIGDNTILGHNDAASGHRFNGHMAEVIFYNTILNSAQRKLIENYLGAKYGITIANDLYAYNTTHGKDVAGIGNDGLPNIHLSATSGFVKIHVPEDLGTGEYLLFGHDNASVASWISTEVPNTEVNRLSREWRVNITGDVGTVSITIDTTGMPQVNENYNGLMLMVDADGDFSEGAAYYFLQHQEGSIFRADNVTINNGNYLAVGSARYLNTRSGDYNQPASWYAGVVPASGHHPIIQANTTLTLSGNATVGSLTIESDASLYLGSSTLSIDGTTINNNGTLYVQTGTIDYAVNGNQDIMPIIHHGLKVSGSGTKSLTASTTVNGALTIENNTTLDVSGSHHALDVRGNWTNAGTFNPRSGTVTLNGNTLQNVTTSDDAFYNLVINNSGNGINMNDGLTVLNQLTLTDGVITTGGANRITILSDAHNAISDFSESSFINGNLRRQIASNTSTYVFPVGNGVAANNYYRADLLNNNLTGVDYMDSRFKPLDNHNDLDMIAWDIWLHGSLMYDAVASEGVWEIEPDAQPSGGFYNIRLYTANINGLTDNNFAPLKRPVGSVTANDWSNGNGALNNNDHPGRTLASGYAQRNMLTSFSEFGIGRGEGTGAGLPIELINFKAVAVKNSVLITWVTATETNNDFFTVERSKNGIDFEIVGSVPGKGNSSVVNEYNLVDMRPHSGVSYYRLKQTDFDGAYEYSNIVSVTVENGVLQFSIHPNPITTNQVNIKMDGVEPQESETNYSFSFTDLNGRELIQTGLHFNNTLQEIVDLPGAVMTGVYIVTIISENGERWRQKVIVQK